MSAKVVPLALGMAVLAGGALAIGLGGARLLPHAAAEQKPVILNGRGMVPAEHLPTKLPGQVMAVQPQRVVQAQPSPQPTPLPPPSEAPVEADPNVYERIEPRPPLSDAYALPSRKSETKPGAGKEEWRMTRLFNPVASAAGRLEAKGHKVALDGIEPLPADEKCTFNGTSWPCGTVARTAFRSWLRSRAVQCKVPLVAQPEEIHAECYIGKADLAEWLVSNGWARPEAGGPYAGMGDKAKEREAGIYGAPPKPITVIYTLPPSAESIDGNVLDADPPESTPDELSQDPAPGFPPPPAPVPQMANP